MKEREKKCHRVEGIETIIKLTSMTNYDNIEEKKEHMQENDYLNTIYLILLRLAAPPTFVIIQLVAPYTSVILRLVIVIT